MQRIVYPYDAGSIPVHGASFEIDDRFESHLA